MSQQRNEVCDEGPQKEKANWDQALTAIFLEICVERVKAGDRPNTHFTRDGWKKIISSFFDKTGELYDQPQFKNKWDNLKKDWRVWEKLVIGETGLGWDNTHETVVADNEWWDRKIKTKSAQSFEIMGLRIKKHFNFCLGDKEQLGYMLLIYQQMNLKFQIQYNLEMMMSIYLNQMILMIQSMMQLLM
ncbi:L10-interacting MYB domain-containing protein-like [Tripterygium wilfordii]|uniref:L10-interacting MYB domain-containing protein-like n=1 Tax=Tripterygium wilfordii TaxID=458696 RepID=UPI0018F83523|nr:L10-interacting MYB domain-containing protein-like [Tripterygium wilfordii]